MSKVRPSERQYHLEMFKEFVSSFSPERSVQKYLGLEIYKKKGISYADPKTNQTALHLYLKLVNKPT
jgi:hypothetical protein